MLPKRQRCFGYFPVSPADGPTDGDRGQSDKTAQTTRAPARMKEIGKLHRYAADQVAASLAVAQAAMGAIDLTPLQQAALAQLRRAYLSTLLIAVNQLGLTIIAEQEQGQPQSQRSALARRQIDEIVHLYRQYVQIMLER